MERSAGLPDHIEAPEDAHGIHAIWPGNGVPPGSEDWDWREQTMPIPWADTTDRFTRNVVVPTLTRFDPAPGTANGTALIIAPGGAFHFLMVDHEGYALARRLAARGVTCFVLRYRVARTPDDDAELLAFRTALHGRLGRPAANEIHPPNRDFVGEPRLHGEADGRQAVRFVREGAVQYGIDPARIGVAGFSAGGGVAMGAVYEHDAATRPDFAVAVYPAYRGGLPVPEDAPPLFVVGADDDAQVAPISASRLYEAWHAAGKSAELHIFANGAHGFGMRQQDTLSDAWYGLLDNWMVAQGLL